MSSQKSLVTPPTDKTQPIDKRPPTDIKLPMPIPKPRIGQRRAVIRKNAGVILPTPTPIQTSAPIPTLALKAAKSLPEPVAQSKERSQP